MKKVFHENERENVRMRNDIKLPSYYIFKEKYE